MRRNLILTSGTLVLLTMVIAVFAFGRRPQSPQSNVVTVEIRDFKFVPATVTVHQGDTVEWKNEDTALHTATSDSQAPKPGFDSGSISKGSTWRYVTAAKGTYNYGCTYHTYMKGQVIVQ